MALPTAVDLREVGPRDGLQAEAPVDVEARVRLIEALLAAGVRHMEIVSFVSPKAVPAMAGAADVVAAVGAPPGVTRTALVPNLKGAHLALEAGVDEISVTIAASRVYNERNVHMTIDESLAAIEQVVAAAADAKVPVDAVLSCAFGSPYEGDIPPPQIAVLARRLLDTGATTLGLADTTGMATPRRIDEVLAETGPDVGLHLHETRGTGLVNAYAGLLAGVSRFDCSVGGLGGSPFAAGAAGNVATEDLVAMLDDLGIATGIDIDALIAASALLEDIVAHPVPSRVAHVGPRTRLAGN
jgi:hydroxymethylglutaryl-CoA lyase